MSGEEGPALPVCRICQGEDAPLIRPCRCEGTIAYAHPYCLAEWITSRRRLACEVCHTPFSFAVTVEEAPAVQSAGDVARTVALMVRRYARNVALNGNIIWAVCLGVVISFLIMALPGVSVTYYFVIRRGTPVPFDKIQYLCIVLLTVEAISFILWFCFAEFKTWAFIHEEELEGVLPMAAVQAPPQAPLVDEAAIAALNSRFTTVVSGSGRDAAGRYVPVAQAGMNPSVALTLLKDKMNLAKGLKRWQWLWNSKIFELFIGGGLIFVFFLSASFLGEAILQLLVLASTPAFIFVVHMTQSAPRLFLVVPAEVIAAVAQSHAAYWSAMILIGIASLTYGLRLAAVCTHRSHPRLSRALSLRFIFARSTLTAVLVTAVWVVVIPVVMYVCLFPFFVEGEAKVAMTSKEAWRLLRREGLLPFRCRRLSSPSSSATAALKEPLNVIRALFFVVADVWRGRLPKLFDPATCGPGVSSDAMMLQAQRQQQQQQQQWSAVLYRLLHFAHFSSCVLLRACTLSTWLTLVGVLRTTIPWLLSGSLAFFFPYTVLARGLRDRDAFFRLFTQLRGRVVWRLLCEIPLTVALYTATVGLAAFATLHRVAPDTLPRSVSYLSFYAFASRLSEVDFVYCWLRIIRAVHRTTQAGLKKFFLTEEAGGAVEVQRDERSWLPGDQAVERAAYSVSVFCVHVAIGVVIESVSQNPFFPFVGLFLHSCYLVWHAFVVGGGVDHIHQRLSEWRVQATLLCMYGTHVTFKDGVEACTCVKRVQVRPHAVLATLMQRAVSGADLRHYTLLVDLVAMPIGEEFACTKTVLKHVAESTWEEVRTTTRLAATALVAFVGPMLLCSLWRLDYVTRLSTDYMALPFWFVVPVRWATGAAAAAAWCVVEARLLRTALSHRCLEFAPLLLLGEVSLEALHAVAIPLAIHCGAVRLLIAVLEYLSSSPLLSGLAQTSPLKVAVLFLLSFSLPWVGKSLRKVRRPAAAALPVARRVVVAEPARQVAGAPAPAQAEHVENEIVNEDVRGEAAQDEHGEAENVDAEAREQEVEQPPAAPPAAPPVIPKQTLRSRLNAYLQRQAASLQKVDVVLVDYVNPFHKAE